MEQVEDLHLVLEHLITTQLRQAIGALDGPVSERLQAVELGLERAQQAFPRDVLPAGGE
jgi:hypothetical protein